MVDARSAAERESPPEPEHLVLAGEFPEVTEQEWVALVDGVLRKARRIPDDAEPGAGVAKLVRRNADGVGIRPLYTAAPDTPVGVPGGAPFTRGATAAGPVPDGWDVRQRVTSPDQVLPELENGASSVWIPAGADPVPFLDGVFLDLATVVLDTGGADTGAAAAFLDHAESRGVDPATLQGTLGLDPIGRRARTGDGADPASVAEIARRVAGDHPHVRTVVVDALPVHTAGGSDGQELGFALASGVAYLRALTDAGLDLPAAAGCLEFRFAATAEQFPTIAKLRAARRLWARVTEACGQALPQAQHAVTSPTMYTRRDPWVNLLRGTVAGFAAGTGGADAVTVAPFDAALGAPAPFSRRIARNTQSLLVMEAHTARVVDPAGGSWFVETLTDELAQAAWAFFQEIEAAGGAVAALDAGLVAEKLAAVRAGREKDVATRKAPITGVSEFPDLHEKPVQRDPLPATDGGGLPVWRPAGAYEGWRDRADAAGTRPTAFLATLGSLAAYSARAAFARNLLAAGGIDAVEAGPTETAQDVATAFGEAGTPVAVLCSTDALYGERAAETVAALRDAGASTILLAGRADIEGLDGQLYAGGDALATIEQVHAALGGAR